MTMKLNARVNLKYLTIKKNAWNIIIFKLVTSHLDEQEDQGEQTAPKKG